MLPFVALQVPNANTQASLYHFYTTFEFVVSDFLSNKALLLPDLYKKFEDLVDKTASQSVFFPIFAHVDMKTIKHDSNWLFRMLSS
jgi:hypothetical protein